MTALANPRNHDRLNFGFPSSFIARDYFVADLNFFNGLSGTVSHKHRRTRYKAYTTATATATAPTAVATS